MISSVNQELTKLLPKFLDSFLYICYNFNIRDFIFP